jgi:hypothetical protein
VFCVSRRSTSALTVSLRRRLSLKLRRRLMVRSFSMKRILGADSARPCRAAT